MLYIILGASIILNIFLVWYIRELLIRFSYIEKNSVFFHSTMLDFQEHLETDIILSEKGIATNVLGDIRF